MQIIKQTNLFWYIFMTLGVGTLRLFKEIKADTSLPFQHGNFKLDTILKTFPCGIGIYKDRRGKKVLIKVWRGNIRTYEYYQFFKEILLYELLHSALDRIGSNIEEKYRNIRIPRLLEKEVSPSGLLAVFEYIENCVHLGEISPITERERIYESATGFWRYIGSQLNEEEKNQIPRRTLGDTLFSYFVSFAYAIIRYPSHIPDLLRTIPIVIAGIPSLRKTWQEGLIHRDFHFENVLADKDKVVIIDFGDNAVTHILQIFTNSLHWEWDNKESRSVILKGIASLCGKSENTDKSFRTLFAISAVQLLHDAESRKRLELNFRCFNGVINEWDDISKLLSGISKETSAKKLGSAKEEVLSVLRKIRAPIMRTLKPVSKYVLLGESLSLQPLSDKYGYDRGTPIDRYYIERFLSTNQDEIKGRCLEIHDNYYTKKFGEDRVIQADVLDMHTTNKSATIYGDLTNIPNIKDNTYDTIILTQTLGMIADCRSALSECYRILKPEGTLLFTSKAMGPVFDPEGSYWKFTQNGVKYLFSQFFSSEKTKVGSYGNILSGQAFWVGIATEELTKEQLDYNDPRYEIIITAVAKK